MKKIVQVLVLVFFANNMFPQTGILWEISGNGLKQKSYLYGTIHVRDKRVFSYGKKIEKIISKSEAVAIELNIDSVKLKGVSIMNSTMMPDSVNLTKLLSQQEHELVTNYFMNDEKLKIFSFFLEKMKPMYTISLLELKGFKVDTGLFLDLYLANQAKKNGKKVLGVEKIEEQLGAIDVVPLEIQAKMLVESVKETEKNTTEDNQMLDLYLNQKIGELLKIYLESNTFSEEFNKAIIVDRNQKMAKRIDKYIHEQSTFVAIGALHLPGKEGLIQILENKGYKVKRVKFKFKYE